MAFAAFVSALQLSLDIPLKYNLDRTQKLFILHALRLLEHTSKERPMGHNYPSPTLQLIQRVLRGFSRGVLMTPVLASLHWLPIKSKTMKSPSHLEKLETPYYPNSPLHPQSAGLLKTWEYIIMITAGNSIATLLYPHNRIINQA